MPSHLDTTDTDYDVCTTEDSNILAEDFCYNHNVMTDENCVEEDWSVGKLDP